MPAWAPLRIIAAISGLLLVKALLALIARYLLALRGSGTLTVGDGMLTLTAEWRLLGRTIRRSIVTAPIRSIAAIRFENRQRYLYLVVGFGCLVVGTLIGAQWFLDGLRAGYPYLTLVGAIVVAAGVAADVALYLFFPFKKGHSFLIISLGPWTTRFRGVNRIAAEAVMEAVHRGGR